MASMQVLSHSMVQSLDQLDMPSRRPQPTCVSSSVFMRREASCSFWLPRSLLKVRIWPADVPGSTAASLFMPCRSAPPSGAGALTAVACTHWPDHRNH